MPLPDSESAINGALPKMFRQVYEQAVTSHLGICKNICDEVKEDTHDYGPAIVDGSLSTSTQNVNRS